MNTLAESQAREAKLREALTRANTWATSSGVTTWAGPKVEEEWRSDVATIRAALALPSDSSALREVCERVARRIREKTPADPEFGRMSDEDLKAIVDRVLGGGK